MALTEKQEVLVKESWEILKQNIPEYSIRLFLRIMEVAPQAKNMFSFLRDSDEIPQNNPKLQAHAVKVFKLTCESVIQLRECGAVAIAGSTMKHLGSVHLKIGVTDRQFDVCGERRAAENDRRGGGREVERRDGGCMGRRL
ncbi:hypothetical protein EUGRSUZ_G02733 [Eucalyptus grandis]|uniref:Uncharacterized protein n=2 Tax=Eucalyptus grandis TaxID=71139 RepID=A0ACC3K7D4_EUCGR|nr:hypothetical protein EUGRSUZ_G02733 [Eucalyptus grandis]